MAKKKLNEIEKKVNKVLGVNSDADIDVELDSKVNQMLDSLGL